MPYVLVLYYSQHGSVSNMAQVVARGVNRQLECRLRTVPEVSPTNQATSPGIPERGAHRLQHKTIWPIAKASSLVAQHTLAIWQLP